MILSQLILIFKQYPVQSLADLGLRANHLDFWPGGTLTQLDQLGNILDRQIA